MRIFHVSEEADIAVFEPRRPTRTDLDQNVGLVWAIDEARLPNYLTPRDCPRVTYHVGPGTTMADRRRFFSCSTVHHALVIERKWLKRLRETVLYVYEFDPAPFTLQDEVAGYYVATTTQRPQAKYRIDDLLDELVRRNVEIRITDTLWDIAEAVQSSTLNWSLCRMSFAQPREDL